MKIHRFTLLAALLSNTAFAQNTFPASGNVGIGTTTPISLLNVVANYHSADNWLGVFSPGLDANGKRKELILGYHGGEDYAYIQGHHQDVRWSNLILQRYGGYVGIGTTGPQGLLHLSQANANAHLIIDSQSSGSGDAAVRLIRNGINNEELRIIAAAGGASGQNNQYLFDTVGNPNARDIQFRTSVDGGSSYSSTLKIAASGQISIGTVNLPPPAAKLVIGGGFIGLDSGFGYTLTDIDTGGYRYVLKRGAPGVVGGTNDLMLTNRAAGGDTIIGSNSGLTGGELEGLRIKALTGNVGIGTTNPTHKLAVNGTIKAKEVIVETTGWSDYVFADGYALQPLAQVEAHIKEHKHLPGIPSASTVASNGVNVGDMQAALLAKVEELTLHLIAQEKELARLRETEKDVASLRAEVRQLRQTK